MENLSFSLLVVLKKPQMTKSSTSALTEIEEQICIYAAINNVMREKSEEHKLSTQLGIKTKENSVFVHSVSHHLYSRTSKCLFWTKKARKVILTLSRLIEVFVFIARCFIGNSVSFRLVFIPFFFVCWKNANANSQAIITFTH